MRNTSDSSISRKWIRRYAAYDAFTKPYRDGWMECKKAADDIKVKLIIHPIGPSREWISRSGEIFESYKKCKK